MGVSITAFLMGVVVYPTINTVSFDDYFSSHDIPTALANMPQIVSEETGPKFIDYSHVHKAGYPIQFIIEKPSDRNCNSYDAKITDDEGNFILGWGAEISCDPAIVSSPVQTKIGYNENKPIIINESGKYYLEVEFVDAFIKQEFTVRQNHGGGTLDRTVYPIPFDMPSPHKQMELGIKLGHIICDKDKVPVWNTHYKPACVFADTEFELIKRGWAKLRLMLPASPFPEKEMEWTGRNVMSMMLEGTFSYSSTPVETLDEKRAAVWEYSQQYHLGEEYLEYAIIPYQYHYDVGDKVQFELLEWGIYSDCRDLKLRIIDMHEQSVFENSSDKLCIDHDGTSVTFNSYSMGDDFEEFVCDKPGYYRIEVSKGDIFPPTILQNFACLESEQYKVHLGLRLLNQDEQEKSLSPEPESKYPEIPQNDMYCWTEWYLEKTIINESELIPSIQKTIAGFGSHVDVPNREITVVYNDEETVISVAGVWTKDQIQHTELTSVVKNYVDNSKIIRDDIISCS